MTVGELRAIIAGLPDDANVRPQWRAGDEPQDHAPGVVLHGFDVSGGELIARVGLFYLDDIDDAEWEIRLDGDAAELRSACPDSTWSYLKEVQ